MATKIYISGKAEYYVGHVGDNLATILCFPISCVLKEFGTEGSWEVIVKRPGEEQPYPVAETFFQVDTDYDYLEWTLTSTDTAIPGVGQVQYRYVVDGVVKYSRVLKFIIHPSLVSSEETPSYLEMWIDAITDATDGFLRLPADPGEAGYILATDGENHFSWIPVSGITVDQHYDPTSANAQSGTAVAEAISGIVGEDEVNVLTGVLTANEDMTSLSFTLTSGDISSIDDYKINVMRTTLNSETVDFFLTDISSGADTFSGLLLVDDVPYYVMISYIRRMGVFTAIAMRMTSEGATVNDGVLTLKKNGVALGTFSANQAGNSQIDIPVPTTVAELPDASNYETTQHADATYLKKNDAATTYLSKADANSDYLKKTDAADDYQEKLTAGDNITLAAGGSISTKPKTATATLLTADWVNGAQTVAVQGMTASATVFVSPQPAYSDDYADDGIKCTAQGSNFLTFTADTTPTGNLTVNIAFWL